MITGGCLCGSVAFKIDGELQPATACHCGQCRKQSGHFWDSADVRHQDFRLLRDAELRWYQASDKARRGFCGTCGSFLFWEPLGQARIGVAMGSLDAPTMGQIEKHIFVADKGDYYEIADGLPQELAPP